MADTLHARFTRYDRRVRAGRVGDLVDEVQRMNEGEHVRPPVLDEPRITDKDRERCSLFVGRLRLARLERFKDDEINETTRRKR